MRCAMLNPIRFYDAAKVPDFSSQFPYWDNMPQRAEYVKGVIPMPFYKEFLAGKTINLQFEQETTESTVLTIKKRNDYTGLFEINGTITPVDITPSGWVGESIYSYSKSFTAGTYYLSFADGLTSDIFTVISDSELIRELVKVDYSHRENDFGCIFDGGYTFTNFFAGQFLLSEPENEKESFESDRGAMINLQSTPKRVFTLNINDLHISYIDHINLLFSLSDLTVNGIEVESVEGITTEKGEYSDSVNVTIKLYQKDFDYYYKR